MTALVAMVLLGAVCLVFRMAFITIVPAGRLPGSVRRGLAHLAPAALASLITVELVQTTTGSDPATVALVLGSAALVAIVVRVTKSMSIAVGVALAAALVIDLACRGI